MKTVAAIVIAVATLKGAFAQSVTLPTCGVQIQKWNRANWSRPLVWSTLSVWHRALLPTCHVSAQTPTTSTLPSTVLLLNVILPMPQTHSHMLHMLAALSASQYQASTPSWIPLLPHRILLLQLPHPLIPLPQPQIQPLPPQILQPHQLPLLHPRVLPRQQFLLTRPTKPSPQAQLLKPTLLLPPPQNHPSLSRAVLKICLKSNKVFYWRLSWELSPWSALDYKVSDFWNEKFFVWNS